MPTYELWGESVDLEIPKDVFPPEEVLKEIEERFNYPEHGFFSEGTHDNKKLHYRKYVPSEGKKLKAIVIYAHGIHAQGGYGMKKSNGKYTQLGIRSRAYPKAGFGLYVPDMLGHGFSEGHRFYVPDYKTNRDDLLAFVKHVALDLHPGVPVFLSGESYGGCLTLHVARCLQDSDELDKTNVKGVVLNCPAIVGDLPPRPVVWFLRYGLAPFFPRWTPSFMPHPISADRIWKEEEPRTFHSDKSRMYGLTYGGYPFCLGTAVALLVALQEAREKAIPGLDCKSLLVHHGTSDYGVKIEGSDYLMEHCNTQDKKLVKVEDGYHDLFSGDDAEERVQEQLEWMEKRL